MKKSILFCLVSIIFILLFLSCDLDDKDTITFWLMPNAPYNIHISWLLQKADEFKEIKEITVEFEIVGWGDAWPKISNAIATGGGVDVFQMGSTWTPQFAATGGLAQLNINDFGGVDSFLKANLESCNYKDKYYGVPWFAETRVLFYNTQMFSSANAIPPTTHDELIEAAIAIINEYGGGSAISIAGANAWDLLHNWAILLWQNGGSILNQNNSYAVFNNSIGIDAWKWYINLIENGYASHECASYNQPQADAAFISGSTAMCYMGPWNIANIAYDNPDLQYDVLEPPSGSFGKAAFAGGSNLVILKNSSKKEHAEEWIKYLLKKDNQVEYSRDLINMLPVKISALDDPSFSTGKWQTFKETINYATAYPQKGLWGDIENAIVNALKNTLIDYKNGVYNEQTVANYLGVAASQVNYACSKEP